jgi:hypothetical protein
MMPSLSQCQLCWNRNNLVKSAVSNEEYLTAYPKQICPIRGKTLPEAAEFKFLSNYLYVCYPLKVLGLAQSLCSQKSVPV